MINSNDEHEIKTHAIALFDYIYDIMLINRELDKGTDIKNTRVEMREQFGDHALKLIKAIKYAYE